MTIQVNPIVSPRIITIPEADGNSITIQSLVNQIRGWEDNQANLCYPSLLSASGKQTLSETELVGITAQLQNTKLKFADRTEPTDCDVLGGNLVAVDVYGEPMNPIEHSANVTVTVSKSSSATMVQDADIDAIKAKTDNIPAYPAYEGEYTPILETVQTLVDTVEEIETGRWKLDTQTKRLILYDSNNEIIKQFELFDKDGNPTTENIYERKPV